jgi:hypothetical protein
VTLTPEVLYLQLGQLVAEMPDLAKGSITADMNRWLGRAAALVEATGDTFAHTMLTTATYSLNTAIREMNAQTIAAVVHQALAKAELAAPAPVQGVFIATGHGFDAVAAVSKVLSTAKSDVLLIDPYADAKVLTDYAVSAPEQVSMRLLTDQASHKPSLKPAAERWVKQFNTSRPLTVRLGAARALHDRLILIDGTTAWTLGQSFKDLAAQAHTSLVRSDPELSALKVAAYEQMWAAATPL